MARQRKSMIAESVARSPLTPVFISVRPMMLIVCSCLHCRIENVSSFVVWNLWSAFEDKINNISSYSFTSFIDYSKSDARTLHVKNLPYDAHEDDVKEIFQDVCQVRILTDRFTGKSRG